MNSLIIVFRDFVLVTAFNNLGDGPDGHYSVPGLDKLIIPFNNLGDGSVPRLDNLVILFNNLGDGSIIANSIIKYLKLCEYFLP